jgi:hypothetical protein
MSRALPFTQAGLRRAIEVARKAGLRETGIRPDGTVMTADKNEPLVTSPARLGESLEHADEVVL